MSKKKKKEIEEQTDERPMDCVACKGTCCRHVALAIDKPTCKSDYDNIRWYLMHQNVRVFVDHEKDWLLEFKTKCDNLQDNFRCGDYENRPKICRDYPPKGQLCEYQTDEPSYTLLFNTASEFEAWLDKRKVKWKHKNLK